MMHQAERRKFLKAAIVGTGMLPMAAQTPQSAPKKPSRATEVRISSASYAPAEFPITPKTYSQVALRDTFWKPKVTANAEVTIPFEIRKFAELDRSLSGGVLEAAILSLPTHPDPAL